METKVAEQNGAGKGNGKELSTELHHEVSITEPNFFQSEKTFTHAQRVALMLCQSDLVPMKFKGKEKVGNCIIALEMAYRMNASPLMIMQNLNVIQGTPAWSSVFLIASLNACGRFSPLRYEEDEQNGGRARAWAVDKGTGEKIFGAWVTMEMATAEGWIAKNGSKWKTMPQLMRRYRAASFFVKQFAPEISMGFQTVEEVYDIQPVTSNIEERKTDKVQERIELLLKDITTIGELNHIAAQIPEEYKPLWEAKRTELEHPVNIPSAEGEEEPYKISDELKEAIMVCETIEQLNIIDNANPQLWNEREYCDFRNKQKIKIGKTLKGRVNA